MWTRWAQVFVEFRFQFAPFKLRWELLGMKTMPVQNLELSRSRYKWRFGHHPWPWMICDLCSRVWLLAVTREINFHLSLRGAINICLLSWNNTTVRQIKTNYSIPHANSVNAVRSLSTFYDHSFDLFTLMSSAATTPLAEQLNRKWLLLLCIKFRRRHKQYSLLCTTISRQFDPVLVWPGRVWLGLLNHPRVYVTQWKQRHSNADQQNVENTL